MQNFTSIDFKLIKGYRKSTYQVGLVRIENFELKDEINLLMQTPTEYYRRKEVNTHGIALVSKSSVLDFDEVWRKIKPLIEGQSIVVYNGLTFEFPIINKALNSYDVTTLITFKDFSEKMKYQEDHKHNLQSLCEQKHIPLIFNDAMSVARACSALYLIQLNDSSSLKKSINKSNFNALLDKLITQKNDKEHSTQLLNPLINPFAWLKNIDPNHNSILSFLLDPTANHKQGNLLLLDFLDMIEVTNPEHGNWEVTTDILGIDILLKREHPESKIIIEYKSKENQSSQIYKYWHEHMFESKKRNNKDKNFQTIYISKDGKVPSSECYFAPKNWSLENHPKKIYFKTLTYNVNIRYWFINCKKLIPEDNNQLRAFLNFYIELWKNKH